MSPATLSVAFIRATSSGVSNIYRVSMAGGEPTRLTTGESLRGVSGRPTTPHWCSRRVVLWAAVCGAYQRRGANPNAYSSVVKMRVPRPFLAMRTDLRSFSKRRPGISGNWTFRGGAADQATHQTHRLDAARRRPELLAGRKKNRVSL
jgi:hypothetical protein